MRSEGRVVGVARAWEHLALYHLGRILDLQRGTYTYAVGMYVVAVRAS
jgi:hypothetical protein